MPPTHSRPPNAIFGTSVFTTVAAITAVVNDCVVAFAGAMVQQNNNVPLADWIVEEADSANLGTVWRVLLAGDYSVVARINSTGAVGLNASLSLDYTGTLNNNPDPANLTTLDMLALGIGVAGVQQSMLLSMNFGVTEAQLNAVGGAGRIRFMASDGGNNAPAGVVNTDVRMRCTYLGNQLRNPSFGRDADAY